VSDDPGTSGDGASDNDASDSDAGDGTSDTGSSGSPTLPAGVTYRERSGKSGPCLATRGTPVYGEPSDGDWRLWDARRSKVAAMYEKGIDLGLAGNEKVLYLGAASGTTASHVADFSHVVYAVEFAARPTRDLVGVADDRENLFPLLADARTPETYAHVVEPVDVITQDVATRGQARVALANRRFLRDDGRLILAVKARSEDVTADPADAFEAVLADLWEGYEVLDTARLEPFHADHLGVVARPR
jgi:fibrillarin-like pre-rRNA processing protein